MKQKFIEFYMKIAEETSKLSSARKLQVGCIAVKENRIVAYGYNGTPNGWSNNCEIQLDDGRLKTKPEVLHAEMNCLMKIARSNESSENCILFITHSPCIECSKAIYQSGINKVYYKNLFRSCDGIEFLNKANISIQQYGDVNDGFSRE